jgi:hypothetical protein
MSTFRGDVVTDPTTMIVKENLHDAPQPISLRTGHLCFVVRLCKHVRHKRTQQQDV